MTDGGRFDRAIDLGMHHSKIVDTLKELAKTGDEVEITIRVRAKVASVSDSHGVCAKLFLERRDFQATAEKEPNHSSARTVWVDYDEVVEVQP